MLIKLINEDNLPVLINPEEIILVDEVITSDIERQSRIFLKGRMVVKTNISIDELASLILKTQT